MSKTFGECGEFVLNADATATAADRIAVAADRVQTTADAVATALDVVSTTADALSAADSAATAGTANFKGRWVDQTGAASVPYTVFHENLYWTLLDDLVDVTSSEPGVIANWEVVTDLPKKVIPQTISGTLTAGGQINQIRDSGAFTMPLANSVAINTILVVELPDTYSVETPSLTRSGTDLFENIDGTDTVINWVGAAKLTFTSNGVDRWKL